MKIKRSLGVSRHFMPTKAKVLVLGLGLSQLCFSGKALAVIETYNGSNVWDLTTPNWVTGTGAAEAWTNGNAATFSGTGQTVDINAAIIATSTSTNQGSAAIVFSSSGYNITDSDNNGSLTLNGTGTYAISDAATTGTNTISLGIAINGGSKSVYLAAGSTLVLSGNISEGTAGTVLTAGGAAGTLTLSGTNTFTGGVTLGASGILFNIGSAAAPGTGTITLGKDDFIDNSSGGSLTLSNNNSINLTGGSLTFVGTNNLSLGTGGITATGANRTVTATAGTLTVAGLSQDTSVRGFTKLGAGTLAITGASTIAGGFTLSAGTVIVGNAASLELVMN